MTGSRRAAQSATTDAIALAQEIRPKLAGYPSAVQGAILAQLLATWLASHPEIARNGLLDDHIASVQRMVPIVLERQK